MIEVTIPLRSSDEAILVLGPYDRHAKLLRQALGIEIFARGGNLRLKGAEEQVSLARGRIEHLLGKVRKGREVSGDELEAILLDVPAGGEGRGQDGPTDRRPARERRGEEVVGRVRGRPTRIHPMLHARVRAVEPRGQNQRRYFEAMQATPLTFGLGAAGTGKTYLAVAAAIGALRRGEVRRLIITRPVVEAGERLGFLPGDLQAKLDPYMRPVYDALGDILDYQDLAQLEESGVIEVAPLAYMRGRTLAHAFVILDEGQNASVNQMKMFLTRMGEGSRVVVTGDPSQVDLARGVPSGLADAVRRLRGYEGVAVCEFSTRDIVRHPLVEAIVRAYERPAQGEGAPASDGGPPAADGLRGGETA